MAGIDNIEIIGLVAATLTTAAFLPQVYQTWKTKDVSGLSLPMFTMFFVGIVFWLIYGVLKESLAIILANAITVVSSFLLLYFKIKYDKK
ncbi:MtN3 and saliva related transmembrane protein [Dokdonia sp. Hel_I_63]|uniref:SemiSWEET family sugar transporter n=1 Tax=unclassified Dokdonia TaxID=2615033 RepID=UPI00020A7A96|nr:MULTISPECIES: SemiSWEET transporter [unclassified Dokdonia]AEE19333.1 MtN3/saliva-related transmembrane protein, conserved region [Dokdonia sp. 4H-3-7-5]TVZ21431.1 MtN3 and saliva related transmembrane protein [Dokdonia sp. Hel_I_63]